MNGVKFDGIVGAILVEAKGPGFTNFVSNGVFLPWWRGADDFVDQAHRQLIAARGAPVEWRFAEQGTANAARMLFNNQPELRGIRIVVIPPAGP